MKVNVKLNSYEVKETANSEWSLMLQCIVPDIPISPILMKLIWMTYHTSWRAVQCSLVHWVDMDQYCSR